MRVVADTGPINYLVLIEHVSVLADLFGGILIPETVRLELSRSGAPPAVRAWIAAPPSWVSVRPDPQGGNAALQRLDAGEQATILLAIACRADLILMDDRAGVGAARAGGLTAVGTLGLLDAAARRGLLGIAEAVARLQATNFRCRPELLRTLLDRRADP